MISKKAASVPVKLSALVPRPSSVTKISPTLIGEAVLVFSTMEVTALFSATAVGAAFGTADGA